MMRIPTSLFLETQYSRHEGLIRRAANSWAVAHRQHSTPEDKRWADPVTWETGDLEDIQTCSQSSEQIKIEVSLLWKQSITFLSAESTPREVKEVSTSQDRQLLCISHLHLSQCGLSSWRVCAGSYLFPIFQYIH